MKCSSNEKCSTFQPLGQKRAVKCISKHILSLDFPDICFSCHPVLVAPHANNHNLAPFPIKPIVAVLEHSVILTLVNATAITKSRDSSRLFVHIQQQLCSQTLETHKHGHYYPHRSRDATRQATNRNRLLVIFHNPNPDDFIFSPAEPAPQLPASFVATTVKTVPLSTPILEMPTSRLKKDRGAGGGRKWDE